MKNEIQKAKHKLDGDLRCSQEAALELERSKSEVQQAIQRKDKEFAAMQAKIEDEQGLGSKLQKQVKELGVSFLNILQVSSYMAFGFSVLNVSRKTSIVIKTIQIQTVFDIKQHASHYLMQSSYKILYRCSALIGLPLVKLHIFVI